MDHYAEPFCVLFVCTANLCRSPMAQFLMRQQLEALGSESVECWSVQSAGVAATPGTDMHPLTRTTLQSRSTPTQGFETRAISRSLLASADLILTAEAAHRSAVARLLPAAASTAFTIKQFAELCAQVPRMNEGKTPQAGRMLLSQALMQRGRVPMKRGDSFDLRDPIGGSSRRFRQCAESIDKSISVILDPLR